MSSYELQEIEAGGDENKIVDVLRRLAKGSPDGASLSWIRRIAARTASPRIRNAAAMALANARGPEDERVLISLLRRADTRNSRGTLLYALDEMGANVPLDVLVDIIFDDGYEAREEALGLIAKLSFSLEERQAAIPRLKRLEAVGNYHERELAAEAIEHLTTE